MPEPESDEPDADDALGMSFHSAYDTLCLGIPNRYESIVSPSCDESARGAVAKAECCVFERRYDILGKVLAKGIFGQGTKRPSARAMPLASDLGLT